VIKRKNYLRKEPMKKKIIRSQIPLTASEIILLIEGGIKIQKSTSIQKTRVSIHFALLVFNKIPKELTN
jgi:hypothetical protein